MAGNQKNVCLSVRKKIEEEWNIKEKLKMRDGENTIQKIKVLGFAATALLSQENLFMDTDGEDHISFREECQKLAAAGTEFYYVLPKQGSFAEREAVRTNKIIGPFKEGTPQQNMDKMRKVLKKDVQFFQGHVQAHWTENTIPYSLVILYHQNPAEDSMKIDLYTPYLSSDAERRSFMILRCEDPDNFAFFEKNFNEFWNHSDAYDLSLRRMFYIVKLFIQEVMVMLIKIMKLI